MVIRIGLTWLFLFILITGCRKEESRDPVVQMKNLAAPGPFNWNATRNVILHLTNVPAGIIRISSENGAVLLDKFFGNGVTTTYQRSLNLPASFVKIAVNDYIISLTGEITTFSFPAALKNTLVTNYSVNFDGTTSWVHVPSASNIPFTNQFTAAAWVKAGRQQTAKIVQKGDWDGLGIGQDLWNGWRAGVAFSDGTSSSVYWSKGLPTLNQWYYVVGTYDGYTLKIYVDGALEASVAVEKTIRPNTRFVSIGSDAGNQKFFQGLIDEVSIWNSAINPQQMTTGRITGFTGNEPGLQGYWKFNEGSGTNCFDLTTNQHTGVHISTLYSTDVGYNAFVDTDLDGVPDNYDDYPSDPQRAFNNYFPSADVNTIAFEDLWPTRGDYDMNDLVVSYRLNTITNVQGMVVETFGDITIHAIGGSFRNGFGFNLPECAIPINHIICTGSALFEDYITLNTDGLEDNQQFPTVIVFDNAYSIMQGQTGSTGVNVTPGATYITPVTVQVHLTYPAATYTLTQLGMSSFNPFMIINKARGREVHLPDHPPTSLADPALFGTQDDDSQPAANRYYKTSDNLPWSICVPGVFAWPYEKANVFTAHLKMASWALSGGTQWTDWYLDLPGYRDNSKIYSHF